MLNDMHARTWLDAQRTFIVTTTPNATKKNTADTGVVTDAFRRSRATTAMRPTTPTVQPSRLSATVSFFTAAGKVKTKSANHSHLR